jgi:hypothetical protein
VSDGLLKLRPKRNTAMLTKATGMAPFLFRCPATGFNVQGWSAEETAPNKKDAYEAVSCLACRQVHLVNPATGEVLQAEQK